MGGNMSTNIKKNIFFPNLNGVRFIAAMMVVVHHIEQIKGWYGYSSLYKDNIYGTNLGGLGVALFFVLSGFLITYLLLVEKRDSGTICIKDFYIRRILRIWPLYFLIVVLAFIIIPVFFKSIVIANFLTMLNVDYYKKLAMYVFFIPNIALISSYPVLFASQAWSVGVEEQFYAIWPLLVKLFKKPIIIMTIIVIFYLIINLLFDNLISKTGGRGSKFFIYREFFLITRIDCMAIGGMCATISLKKNKFYEIITNKIMQLIVYLIAIVLIYHEFPFKGLGHLPYAALFGIIIINLATNDGTILRLKNSVFEYGGKISYGIYMFHGLGIILSFLLYKRLNVKFGMIGTNLALYGVSIGLTLLLSAISYQFYEKYFLVKKIKFSSIVSGDNVSQSKE